jgi:hypothetical protein
MYEEMKDILRSQGLKAKGYGIIPKLVMQDKRLSIESKSIYSYFCSYAGAGDTAFPSVRKICYDFSISEDRFRRHFRLLVQYGYIEVEQKKEKGRYASNIYTLVDKPIEVNTRKTPYTENGGMEEQGTENTRYNINNKKINNKEKSQLVSQTNEQTNEINQIIINARVESFESEEFREIVKDTIKECYLDPVSRHKIKKLKVEHIDRAMASYRIAQEEKEIKNPKLYFRKCLLSAIEESGLKGLF